MAMNMQKISDNTLCPYIQHFLQFLRRYQFTDPSKSKIFLFIRQVGFETTQLKMSIYKFIKVKPKSINSVTLKAFDCFVRIKNTS